MHGVFRHPHHPAFRRRPRWLPPLAAFALPHAAVDFDGSTYLTRGANLTGAADSQLCLFSRWIKTSDAAFNFFNLPSSGGGAGASIFEIGLSLGKVFVNAYTGGGSGQPLSMSGTTAINDDAWHHVLLSVDLSLGTPRKQLFIDGVDDLASTGGSNATMTFSMDAVDCYVGDYGQAPGGAGAYVGCASNLYFAIGESLDLTTSSNVELFRAADGTPENLGSDGSRPTGTQPIVYLRGDAAGFATNYGSGGDFSVAAGSLTDCASTPWGSGGVTVSLSGVAGTGAAGTLSPIGGALFALSGIGATGGAGSLAARGAAAVTLGGIGATGAAGNMSPAGAAVVALAGAAGTGTPGALSVSLATIAALGGVAATGMPGVLAVNAGAIVTPEGVVATGAAGDLAVSLATMATLVGVSSTGGAGSLAIAAGARVTVSGVIGSGSAGSLSIAGGAIVPLAGVGAAGAAGDVTIDIGAAATTVTLTGVAATGAAAALGISAGATVTLGGVSVTATSGSLIVGIPASVVDAGQVLVVQGGGGVLIVRPPANVITIH